MDGLRAGAREKWSHPFFFSDFLDFFKVTVFRLSGIVQSLQRCSCVVGMERSCTLAKFFFAPQPPPPPFLSFLDPPLGGAFQGERASERARVDWRVILESF